MNRVNLSILAPSMILVVISLATFFSLDVNIFKQQVFSLIISIIAYSIFINIDYRIFPIYSKYLYVGIIVLLSIIFLVGVESRGAVRWIEIFGMNIQFSEIFKPFTVLIFAYFLSRDQSRSFKKFLKILLLFSPIFFLTLKQPDLGNALIYLFVLLFMLLFYRFPLRFFVFLGVSFLLLLPIIFHFLHDYQKERIYTFLNFSHDPFGSSYNVVQSMISVGSGGFFGKGFGESTQSILKFLPERHTDFIFATISESLGLVGAGLILFLYFFLLYKIYKISKNIDDTFSYLVIMGFYFLFLSHLFFNIGMNIGIVPVVGITLPFVSYGGSSLLTNFIILGIISSIASSFENRHSMEIQ